MTEHDRAVKDLRADVIDEVAGSMSGCPASQVVAAIVSRLARGLPALVEVDIRSEP